MNCNRESLTPRGEPSEQRSFRAGRASDEAAIREILAEANLSFQVAQELPARESTATGSSMIHVCEAAGEIVGVIQWRDASEEAEILDIAVAAKHRRRGIACFLLEQFLRLVEKNGIRDVYLEVRESNAPAIQMYQQFGFSASGRRMNYYRHPDEAALLYHLKISG